VCKDINCGCVHALDDLHAADEESRNLDAYLAGSKVGSANHSDILVLSTRQTFGTLELTVPSDTLDINSVLAFVKEISRFVFAL
jgi:thiamine monophosphate kinase